MGMQNLRQYFDVGVFGFITADWRRHVKPLNPIGQPCSVRNGTVIRSDISHSIDVLYLG